jgi:membrane-bound serine protease (ClpP class)
MKEKDYYALSGKIAVTDTELSPSGTVLIDNEIYEAKTEGEFIEAGRGVRVTRVRGRKIFVRRV